MVISLVNEQRKVSVFIQNNGCHLLPILLLTVPNELHIEDSGLPLTLKGLWLFVLAEVA